MSATLIVTLDPLAPGEARTIAPGLIVDALAVAVANDADLAAADAAGRLYARIDGVEIAREDWAATPVDHGATLDLFVRPGDPATLIAAGKAAVAAIQASKWVQAAYSVFQGVTLAMSVYSLFAPRPKGPTAEKTRYGLTGGGGNAARPGERKAIHVGALRVTPDLAAEDFQELVGEDTYLYRAVEWGDRDLEVDDIKVGDTPLLDYAPDVMVQHRTKAGDPPITLWPGDVNTISVGTLMSAGGAAGASQTVTRTTPDGTDRVILVFGFREGLVSVDSKGGRHIFRDRSANGAFAGRVVTVSWRGVGEAPATAYGAALDVMEADAIARALGFDSRRAAGIGFSAFNASATGGASATFGFNGSSQQATFRTAELALPRGSHVLTITADAQRHPAERQFDRMWLEAILCIDST